MQDATRNHRLHYVRAVEAVHAICAHRTALLAHYFDSVLRCKLCRLVEPAIEKSKEKVVGVEVALCLSDETRKVLPLHLSAFVVKIEPDVSKSFLADFSHQRGKCVSNSLLRALFVDQIDEKILVVNRHLLLQVLLCCRERFHMVRAKLNFRVVL